MAPSWDYTRSITAVVGTARLRGLRFTLDQSVAQAAPLHTTSARLTACASAAEASGRRHRQPRAGTSVPMLAMDAMFAQNVATRLFQPAQSATAVSKKIADRSEKLLAGSDPWPTCMPTQTQFKIK